VFCVFLQSLLSQHVSDQLIDQRILLRRATQQVIDQAVDHRSLCHQGFSIGRIIREVGYRILDTGISVAKDAAKQSAVKISSQTLLLRKRIRRYWQVGFAQHATQQTISSGTRVQKTTQQAVLAKDAVHDPASTSTAAED